MSSKVILITGCSSGIGRDLTERLTSAGYNVIATARRSESLSDLQAASKLSLDVTNPDSISQATADVVQRFGRIDVLVNNAGYAQRGAIEEIADTSLHQMFDVNVYGAMRMIRAVVPHMRRQKTGRIINISSFLAKFVLPVNGTYSATKFDPEAISDALRLELAAFGIHVVLIEPGTIRTNFRTTSQAHSEAILSNPSSAYYNLYQQFNQAMSGFREQEAGPEVVSEAVQKAIEIPNPRPRYLVAVPLMIRVVAFLGDTTRDFILRRAFKIDSIKRARCDS
jgi:NADP-dependent 3-hydroxy acid dehydrogenase YdfG